MPRTPRTSNNAGKPAINYEDIVRRTVVEPDSSARPSRQQEAAAREGFRALDADEQALHDRVQQALAAAGITGVTSEIARDHVTLRGRVADPGLLQAVEDAVAGVPGVAGLRNLVVVAST